MSRAALIAVADTAEQERLQREVVDELAARLRSRRQRLARRHRRPRHRAENAADAVRGARTISSMRGSHVLQADRQPVSGARRRLAAAGGSRSRSSRHMTAQADASIGQPSSRLSSSRPWSASTRAASAQAPGASGTRAEQRAERRAKRRCRQRPEPVPVLRIGAQTADVPVYLDGVGTAQALNTVTVRRRSTASCIKVAFKEGQDVKKGDVLAKIDPTHLSGALRSGGRQEGAGRGAARQCAARSRALHQARRDQRRQQAAARHADGAGRAARGAGAGRPGGDRQRARDARLHRHRRADRRAHRHPPGRRRQYRACVRRRPASWSSRRSRPISVMFNLPQQHLPRHQQRRSAKAPLPVDALGADGNDGRSTAASLQVDRQPGRPDDRHGELKAEFPNAESAALARPVRQCAAADRHAEAGRGGADRRRAARPERHLRLRRRGRQHGRGAAGHGRAAGRRRSRDRRRAASRRARRHHRLRAAYRRHAGDDRQRRATPGRSRRRSRSDREPRPTRRQAKRADAVRAARGRRPRRHERLVALHPRGRSRPRCSASR